MVGIKQSKMSKKCLAHSANLGTSFRSLQTLWLGSTSQSSVKMEDERWKIVQHTDGQSVLGDLKTSLPAPTILQVSTS